MAGASALHRHTPVLAVQDARGLVLRQVAWYRAAAEQAAARRVSLTRHDIAAQVRRQWDPRLFERADAAPGQHTLASLSGRPLLDESADAGWRLTLPGDAGQTAESWDTRGSHWRTRYDERLRPLRIEESATGQPQRTSASFAYAGEAGSNGRGRLVRQDDEAGSRLIDSYDLNGQVRSKTRHFLATPDLPDWPDAVLEPGDGASTRFVHGPLQEVLVQTDALGNQRLFAFNLSGELKSLVLRLQDGKEHSLLSDARYNPFGQLESQTVGNGVVTHCEYEPSTGRLSRLSASRPGRSTLQDLLYDYDPVGNVLKIEDGSQPATHFANQRVEPVNRFRYDSLYQLIEATGREAVGALIGPQLPELAPNPGDTSHLLNYRQEYEYDANGNLLTLKHVGQQSYTRSMSVADHSNHAVPAPGDPLEAFDANGNLLDLDAGIPLHWSAGNQLHSTRQVAREDGEDDEEHYRYGDDGLRIRKTITRLVSGRIQTGETRYLPGLELHRRQGESFAVITIQAGRCSVRCLLWSEGQSDGLGNPQLRYSLDDHLGSSSLELDNEARIISHEGYYPFGGSAWWAARSVIEADYKTRRYSGKERDSSGLYDYGLRYYAPWLMRWINPDPAGNLDGPNRYRFVRNNPVTLSDPDGLNPVEQHYTIKRFSQGPKASEPARVKEQLGNPSVSLSPNLGPVADFAYNASWTVKDYLHLGAANQAGDIKRSNFKAMVAGTLLRNALGDTERPHRDHVEHAMAVHSGFCDEFGFTSSMLMSSSADWPNVPVYLVSQPYHHSAILGDPRQGDALVVDPWVTLPFVHLWSQSLNAQGDPPLTDYTPRMPGDPRHAIDRQQVERLREQHFSNIPVFPEAYMQSALDQSIVAGFTWADVTAMKQPHEVLYDLNGSPYNAATIPVSLYDATSESLEHALRLKADPRFSAQLRTL